MAINFSSSNLNANANNTFTIEKFNGVDYTTTPTQVDDSRAIVISNYLPEGESLVKRYGYSVLIKLEEKLKELDVDATKEIVGLWQFNNSYICYVLCSNKNAYLIRINNFIDFNNDDYEFFLVYKN